MKNYLFLFLLVIPFYIFSQKGEVYYSYPDKGLELVLYKNSFKWNSTRNGVYKNKVYKYRFIQNGDTLYVKKGGYIVLKDDYLDWVTPNQDEQNCGSLFRKESEAFEKDRAKIIKQCQNSNRHWDMIFELHVRIIRLELFDKWCELEFPPIYDEHF